LRNRLIQGGELHTDTATSAEDGATTPFRPWRPAAEVQQGAQATGINNDGWIAVNGYDTDNMAPPNTTFGLPRSYLLRPIR
jgi:hypothetical protein